MAAAAPLFNPAGFDVELRPALDDVRAGRWIAMRELLHNTSTWASWTSRSQILAAAAAGGDAVEAWAQEEPRSYPARMMRARVEVQRALNAHRTGDRDAESRTDRARLACEHAAAEHPDDPVPWLGLLTLAQVDSSDEYHRRPEHRIAAWEPPLPAGPWGLLAAVLKRDRGSREAWHRLLQALQAYGRNTSDFARWVSSWAEPGSPLAVIPLYVYADIYRERRESGQLTSLFWTTAPVSYYTRHALERWFPHADRSSWSPLDLNYLAQALYSGGFGPAACAEVFQAIGSCATPVPWRYVADAPDRWQEEFLQARRRCLNDE
ncbi:hypothetical protein ACIBCM_02980 [Streptomyces sp. NPDC051018]|uniref:hypothetical protein n=1 Tax=Streptomyces sp. NPDC051018 TaxID=3365639 RepID=UPI0037A16609